MEVVSRELALHYLMELSTDIRVALLIGEDGELLAAAPERPAERAVRASAELAREALALGGQNGAPLELDVTVEGGAVFLIREAELLLVCVTGPFALPGLILHDMRVVMNDLREGSPGERR